MNHVLAVWCSLVVFRKIFEWKFIRSFVLANKNLDTPEQELSFFSVENCF